MKYLFQFPFEGANSNKPPQNMWYITGRWDQNLKNLEFKSLCKNALLMRHRFRNSETYYVSVYLDSAPFTG